jgi:hypothetical protein
MSVFLIQPNLVVQKNDPLTTGIPYMPVGLAYVAACLKRANLEVEVIDAFGLNPRQARCSDRFMFLGLTPEQVLARVDTRARAVFVYAANLACHDSSAEIVAALKQDRPDLPLAVLENTQAVTAYALAKAAPEFFALGADYVLCGEPDLRAVDLAQRLLAGKRTLAELEVDGLGDRQRLTEPGGVIEDLDSLPLPAWEKFPLTNYWNLRFAHGPLEARRYLPLLSSRGCPFACGFCVVPATNHHRWRGRSSRGVVDEMEHFQRTLGVSEFHFEDLNPTVSDSRTRGICSEILDRGLKVTWKLVSGTKIETIKDGASLELMARAGCRYISFSPETGSKRVLELMGKPFDLEHAKGMVDEMNRLGIKSQACFVLGYPGETEEDLALSRRLVRRLTLGGVDEIALFIITPVPGSAIFDRFQGFKTLSELNFTPTWRQDYISLNKFRLRLYLSFLFWKALRHPLKMAGQALNFVRRRFATKMEMTPYRALVYKLMQMKSCRPREERS